MLGSLITSTSRLFGPSPAALASGAVASRISASVSASRRIDWALARLRAKESQQGKQGRQPRERAERPGRDRPMREGTASLDHGPRYAPGCLNPG